MGFWEDVLGVGEQIGTGLYSLADSALFGLPGLLVKTASGDAYKALQEAREKNKIASTIGDIAGFLVPTGGVLKGAGKMLGGIGKVAGKAAPLAKTAEGIGKAAEGLTKAGKWFSNAERTGNFVELAKKGAAEALLQAAPRAMVAEDYSALPSQVALGGIAGGVLGKVLPAVGAKVAGDAKKTAVAGALGLKKADYAKALRGLKTPGAMVKGAERLDDTLEDLVFKKGVSSPKKAAEFAARESDLWRDIDAAFMSSGKTLAGSADEVLANPEIQRVMKLPGGQKAVERAIAEADSLASAGGLGATKARLSQVARGKYTPGASFSQRLEADAAEALSSVVDDIAAKVAPEGTDFAERMRLYGAKKAIDEAAAREALKVSPGLFSGGSDTAGKLLGASIGAGTTGMDFSSPEAAAKTLTGAAAGYLGGNLVNRALPALANKAIRGATRAGVGLTEMVGKPLSEYGADLVARGLGRVQPEDKEKQVDMGLDGIEAQAPEDQKMESSTDAVEAIAAKAEQDVGEALNDRYMGWIDNALKKDWKNFQDQISFEDFKERVRQATASVYHPDGFDPRLAANLLYKDPEKRKTYLEQYKRLEELKAIDMDALLSYQGAVAPAGDILQNALTTVGLQDPNYPKQKRALAQFELLLKNLSLKAGQDLSKEIQGLMRKITSGALGTKEGKEEKAKVIEEALQAYGLDVTGLKNLGLYKGIV